MLKNQIRIALRTLWRNKIFSAINILGLAIGLATCLLIMLFVKHELSYDRYNEKADRIVRVFLKGSFQGEELNESHVMPPTAQTLLADFPEVQEATRLRRAGVPRISYREKSFRDNELVYVDSNFFQVFTLPLLKGDAKTALTEPNTIVISQTVAQRFFGNEDPMGKVLELKEGGNSLRITGIMEDIPENSHFHFDLFASMESLPAAKEQSWLTSEFFTYLVLPPGYDYKQLESKLPQVVEKYMGPQMEKSMGISLAQFREKGNELGLLLQPLTDIHLYSEADYDLGPGGDILYVYIFVAIALFVLLIACINYMNLSTAGASKRAREVGVRKVMGSGKGMLMWQFLIESVLLTLISVLLAIAFVKMTLPLFNELAGKDLSFLLWGNPLILPGFLLLGLLVGVLAGSYSAFFLSSFEPTKVLKGVLHSTAGKRTVGFRSSLVVFQFFVSITLIACTLVVYKQLQYIQDKKLGYEKDQVLIVRDAHLLPQNKWEIFRQQLLQDPRVTSVSASGYLPAGPSENNNFFLFPGDNLSQQQKTLRYDVDEHYIPTMGIKMVAGRNFSPDLATDSSSVILNQTAAKAFGWGMDALGKSLVHLDNQGKKRTLRIIGIVEDFHFKSLYEPISPLVMVLGNSGSLIIKVKGEDTAGLLSMLQNQWTTFSEEPFTYAFLDDRFNKTYEAERKVGLILSLFTGLTIFVACLGLFGLAIYTAEQRRKEVGIRKVLGASEVGIVSLLAKDFTKLVLLSFLFAIPLSWYIMSQWLEGFTYRMEVGPGIFVLAGLIAIITSLGTVSWQAVKAALANPIKSLRNE